MKLLLSALASVFLTFGFATDPYPRNDALDIQHYVFRLELNDSTNRLAGEASITILFKKSTSSFELDLVDKSTRGFGMTVSNVLSDSKDLVFSHQGSRLKISLATPAHVGELRTLAIRYAGIPQDGLIISNNKFGDRTFFGDNWPDRGHHWLPCIDHPSDKATVEFVIVAPDKYNVVASGRKQEESSLPHDQKVTRYTEHIPIAVKVMAIGVARFAVEETIEVDHIPQSTWVYLQNREAGFHDFAVGTKIFEYFHRNIGPYSYEKLAHVQSKTRWGGLENAGNIFYTESSVTGKNQHEGLIAHETAHQWFGNSVTEDDWHHVWLSEGFATYFAALYVEHAYGEVRFAEEMNKDREEVTTHYVVDKRPIVDTTIVTLGDVLSTNTYQKAGWVLHMLRQKIGDDAFWKGIRKYYATYQNKNALTADFRRIMEEASGTDLKPFFNQWLYRGGHPQLSVTWAFDKTSSKIAISVGQQQPLPFQFPLEVLLRLPDGKTVRQTFQVTSGNERFSMKAVAKPAEMELDPDCKLLYEAEIQGR